MLTHSTRRWLAGLGVAGAFVAASATPAHAADPLEIFAWDVLVAPEHTTYNFIATYIAGEEELKSATLDLDLSEVNDVATIELATSDWECVPSGETLHCEAEAEEWGVPSLDYYLTAKSDAKPGQKAELGIKATGGGKTASSSVTVTIAEGVDLQSDPEAKVDGDPGATVGLPGEVVRNSGDNTAHGAVLRLQTDYLSPYVGNFSNCKELEHLAIICTFDTDLEPGKSYQLSEKLPVKLDKGARTGSELENYVDWLTKDDWAQIIDDPGFPLPPGTPGTGGKLSLVELPAARQAAVPQTDVDQTNNFTVVDIKVGGNNPADLAAVGGTATGKVGDKVTVTAGWTNLGPATVDAWRLTEPIVTVEIPQGTEAIKVSEECAPYDKDSEEPWNPWDHAGEPGADLYGCISAGDPEPGVGGSYPFTLRIDKLTGPTSGKVITHLDGDPKADNNEAAVVIKPGNGNPGSGDGGNGGGDGGTLPITGENTGLIAGIGGLLLAAGVGGYVVARRRRTRFVA
ncbi:LPXTG cell wall anchor domain-containing protein [Micromonospora purpureochromogenes]|uniref:LPXTG cell wall anchor domain-containing protein n=1 Tax=Micromonospora purpureochromogenes TaxID=47872 RepID=UPI00363545F5